MTTVREILAFLDLPPDPVGGDETEKIVRCAGTIDAAGPDQFAFCSASTPDASKRIRRSRAGLVLADAELVDQLPQLSLSKTVVANCQQARLDFAKVVNRFFAPLSSIHGIDPSAIVANGAEVDSSASVGPLCTIAEGARVGADCILHAGVHIYAGTRLGRGVIVQSGTVIGSEGFGYERDETGKLIHIHHLGGVLIEDGVEIGANVTIDRGVIEDTIIGRGTCIDNLVHIAHNVRVGASTVVIAHAMVAGSVQIGKRAWIAPSACLRDGVSVGDSATVGMGAVVTHDVDAGTTVVGNPARVIR